MHRIDARDDLLRRVFIARHLNSYFALSELGFTKSHYQRDTLQKMYDALLPAYRDSYYGKVIAVYLKIGDPLKAGDSFTDFTAQDRDGKTHRLSEIKDKYILLDFAETWCGLLYPVRCKTESLGPAVWQ